MFQAELLFKTKHFMENGSQLMKYFADIDSTFKRVCLCVWGVLFPVMSQFTCIDKGVKIIQPIRGQEMANMTI